MKNIIDYIESRTNVEDIKRFLVLSLDKHSLDIIFTYESTKGIFKSINIYEDDSYDETYKYIYKEISTNGPICMEPEDFNYFNFSELLDVKYIIVGERLLHYVTISKGGVVFINTDLLSRLTIKNIVKNIKTLEEL